MLSHLTAANKNGPPKVNTSARNNDGLHTHIHILIPTALIFFYMMDLTFPFPFLSSSAFEIAVQQLAPHLRALGSYDLPVSLIRVIRIACTTRDLP